LMADLECRNLNDRLDHLGIQKAESLCTAGNFISHGCHWV
jgi:hypothetical protein